MAEGQKIAITLVFEKAGSSTLEFAVSKQAPGAAVSEHMQH
jgi:copper(I)-binding protein